MRTLIIFAVIVSICIFVVLVIVRLIDFGISEPVAESGVIVITPLRNNGSSSPKTSTSPPSKDKPFGQGQETKRVISRGPVKESATITGRQYQTTTAPAKD